MTTVPPNRLWLYSCSIAISFQHSIQNHPLKPWQIFSPLIQSFSVTSYRTKNKIKLPFHGLMALQYLLALTPGYIPASKTSCCLHPEPLTTQALADFPSPGAPSPDICIATPSGALGLCSRTALRYSASFKSLTLLYLFLLAFNTLSMLILHFSPSPYTIM